MDSFSFTDSLRAAIASCLPWFRNSQSNSSSNLDTNANANLASDTRSTRSSPNDLEQLLRDADTDADALSLHSNLGASSRRRARQRKRPKFSLTLFGYTLFGRPPIYLSDDEDEQDGGGGRTRALATASTSTLDSDAAPLDPSTIERLTSPDHHAAAQRERERRRLEEEEQARRKAERRARRQERKARESASALLTLSGGSFTQDGVEEFEGFQGSGSTSPPVLHHDIGRSEGYADGSNSGDADDADLGGELYARKKRPSSAVWSGSGSDSRSRTSASFSAGDTTQPKSASSILTQQPIPYPQTEMQLPLAAKKKRSHHAPKRSSVLSSSTTSQSTSTTPYTPIQSISPSPAVAAFPIPQERYVRDAQNREFPSTGLPGGRKPMQPKDVGAFLSSGDTA